ncbi:hypothetical protein BJI67_16200 (plasmid) [Acidihalobacter aeolianus]|uniref:Uncharacterized protein n=1 Tax=Acidihalobacter aeolianus TaxID=2792603 RepID=A0A1D8KCU3_9GAMM|nr:hypothetical protein [Acidihalobacter aeolianus]AOV18780.1 hypothetical protein BJI67_16200 [Acidihalobacter aeolianus]
MGLFSISSLAVAGFIIYIIIGSTPTERITRACMPVPWTANLSVSILELIKADSDVAPTTSWFQSANYGCEFTLWRLFYQNDYNTAQKSKLASNTGVPASQGTSQ